MQRSHGIDFQLFLCLIFICFQLGKKKDSEKNLECIYLSYGGILRYIHIMHITLVNCC